MVKCLKLFLDFIDLLLLLIYVYVRYAMLMNEDGLIDCNKSWVQFFLWFPSENSKCPLVIDSYIKNWEPIPIMEDFLVDFIHLRRITVCLPRYISYISGLFRLVHYNPVCSSHFKTYLEVYLLVIPTLFFLYYLHDKDERFFLTNLVHCLSVLY